MIEQVESLLRFRAGNRHLALGRLGGSCRAEHQRGRQTHPEQHDHTPLFEAEPTQSVEEFSHDVDRRWADP
ncbi:hypothetical protein [Nocardia sp. NPDC049526]|uniref:hypothetical protein n=1 Tax=Nocardia sp. NPDC049526 TaxID=3364316 RepID=UPI0037B43F9E